MTDLQFTPNGTYNGYIRWDATDGVNTYSIVWNSEGYWEMLGWSVGDLRSYSSPNITPLDGWRLYNTRITGTFDVIQGDCIIPTPTPTNTPTPTSTSEPTPTPTPTNTPNLTPTPTPTQEVLINPVLIGDNEYLSVGDNEYLMFVYNEPPITLDMTVDITDGSININYNIVASSIIDEDYTFSFTNTLGLFVGDSIVINTGVTVNSGSISGTTNVIIDENFSNLNPNEISFSGISVDTTGTTFNYDFNIIVDIRPPSNDFTYLIIPDSDLTYLFIPDSDLTYLLLPNNDLTSSIIPNSDIIYTLLPNNDLSYEVLSCTGKTFNLILFPYNPPSEGNIIFPNFNLGFGATLDPNTFTEGGVYWNQIDRNGDNSYPYFENLQNPFILTFTQGIRYASYSGYSGAINYAEGFFFNDGNDGPNPQPQLTLITPSTGNFNLSNPVCISYINIDVPNPTPTPTPTETSTPTPTLTPTPTPTTPLICDTFTFNSINANTTINSAIKTTGGGWDSSAYSVETYTNPVYVTFNMSSTNIGTMGGFSFNPTFSLSTYENATFGLYCENGNLKIYENGNNVFTVFNGGTITPSDLFKVEYDGTVVNYYYNGSLVYTSLQSVTQPLHIFFPLLTENEGVINVCVIETPLPTVTPTPTNTETPTPTPTPGLVTTGLIIQLDADNSISYPGVGTTVFDLTTNSYNHTLTDGASFTTLNGIKCFDCTTNTERVVVNGTGPTLPTSGYTYITWARVEAGNPLSFRTLLYTNSPKYTPITIPDGTNTLGYWDTEFRSSGYDLSSSVGVWVQYAVVGDSSSQTFYINGSQVGSPIAFGSGGRTHWGWGNNNVPQPWGYVANLYLYDRKLSLSEITQQYNFLAPRFVESTPTPTATPTPTKTPNCVRQITVPTLWDGGTSINSNQLKLTQTSETLQIQVNDIITDNIGATSFVGIVSSDGTYTYVFTGPGGGVSFDCQFPLTFSGNC